MDLLAQIHYLHIEFVKEKEMDEHFEEKKLCI